MTKYFFFLAFAAVLLNSCKTVPRSDSADGSTPSSEALKPPTLIGSWKSATPEFAGNGQYATREFNISMSRWEHIYTIAADKEMKKPVYIYRVEGAYILDKPSSKVPGSFEVQFNPSKKYLTLKTKDKLTIDDLGFKECKLTQNKEKDITITGCAIFKSVADCGTEYDLVKMENGLLRFGERPIDNEMCAIENRPEGLASGLKKIN